MKGKMFLSVTRHMQGEVKENELLSYENLGKCDTINGLCQMQHWAAELRSPMSN